METNTRIVRCLFLLSTVYGAALCGDWCTDDLSNLIYCSYGCCGWDDSYCCGDDWGTGSIAGTVVGIIFFCVFVALVVTCCRRRYRPVTYIRQAPAGNASVSVVTSQQTMSSGYVTPAQPFQKPYQPQPQPYPGQYPPQYPGQPGVQQPPPPYPQ